MISENVKIPLTLLHSLVNVLEIVYEHSESLNFTPDFDSYLQSILFELYRKQRSLELRSAYSKITAAKTETERHYARIDYLRLKQEIDCPF